MTTLSHPQPVPDSIPTPHDLGLPPKFSTWRAGQYEAIDQAVQYLTTGSRIVVVNAPTGAGKSGIAVATANTLGLRAVICTSTKPLQQQYLSDFPAMVDIRGRANYLCHLGDGTTCEEGYDEGCPDAPFSQCPYRAAYATACWSNLVCTNYAYWAAIHRYGDGLSHPDLLVCDEAHTSFNEICSVMALEFSERDISFLLDAKLPNHDLGLEGWKHWAGQMRGIAALALSRGETAAKGRSEQSRAVLHRLRRLRHLVTSLGELEHARGEWIFHRRRSGQSQAWCADPVWAAPYANQILFSHARRSLLTSATITRRTLALLGLEPEEYSFIEIPSQFPPGSSPVYWIPTAAVRQGMSQEEERALFNRVDEIIHKMGPRKGIIHTVSYDRAERIYKASRYSDIMILHERGGAGVEGGVDEFRSRPGPAVLVSPAITQGFDFAGTDSEYQIIVKLPFPDSTNPVTRARTGADIVRPKTEEDRELKQQGSDYLDYVVSQTLIQSCGRSMRSAQDRCQSFILDDNWRWWHWRAEKGGCFPFWFRRLLKISRIVPPPLPRVTGASQ